MRKILKGGATLVSTTPDRADGNIGQSKGVTLRKRKTDQGYNVLNVYRANALAAQVVEHGAV